MKLEISSAVSIEISEPAELINLMSDEERIEAIVALSCDDAVIKNVADQIINGCTESGNHGWLSGGETPSTPLSVAIRAVASASSELARKEIESLERMVKSKNDIISDLHDTINSRAGY